MLCLYKPVCAGKAGTGGEGEEHNFRTPEGEGGGDEDGGIL